MDCESKVIKLAIGMDVTLWMAHLGADTVEDDLFTCSIEWIGKGLDIWSDARKASDKLIYHTSRILESRHRSNENKLAESAST
eukprot:UN03668